MYESADNRSLAFQAFTPTPQPLDVVLLYQQIFKLKLLKCLFRNWNERVASSSRIFIDKIIFNIIISPFHQIPLKWYKVNCSYVCWLIVVPRVPSRRTMVDVSENVQMQLYIAFMYFYVRCYDWMVNNDGWVGNRGRLVTKAHSHWNLYYYGGNKPFPMHC